MRAKSEEGSNGKECAEKTEVDTTISDRALTQGSKKHISTEEERAYDMLDAEKCRVRDNMRPKALKDTNNATMAFFQSPAVFDRSLQALTILGIHDDISPGVLRGEACPGLVIIDGPPGTGKSTRLLQLMMHHLKTTQDRILVTSPTNLGVADLFMKSVSQGVHGTLSLAKENMPTWVTGCRPTEVQDARVVFSTVSGRNAPRLRNEHFDAIFLDESALLSEANMWGLIRYGVRRIYMCGDCEQLPALVSMDARRIGADRSMHERIISLGFRHERLVVQYRMHPEILSFPNRNFYEGRLKTAADRKTPVAFDGSGHTPYMVVQYEGEEAEVGTSVENLGEVVCALNIATELRETGVSDIVVLVPYQAQMKRFQAAKSSCKVATIDSFQGKEADAVILLTTRTRSPGFWTDRRRMTVALTRARHILRVLVSTSTSREELGILNQIVGDANERGMLVMGK